MTNEMKIASIYARFSGDTTPTAEEMYPYLQLAENFGSAAATAKIIEDGTLGDLLFGNALTNADKVTTVFQTLFGREPLQDGLDYWVDQFTTNPDYVNSTSLASAVLRGAESNADQTDWNNVLAYSEDLATALADYNTDEPSVPGETFTLTDGRDNLTGTDNDDTFNAYVGQNQDGALANALATGDMVDGGAGSNDTLNASLTNDEYVDSTADNFAVMPVINDVENIRVQALDNSIANDTVTLDADHITAEDHYASDSSRADLVVTNVDITSTQITNDITLEMKDTQQFSDFEVYFNQNDLKAAPDETVGSASVTIQVADGAQTDASNPIGNMTFDLSFKQEGSDETYLFEDLESTDGTYAGLVTAIQVALAAEGLTQFKVEIDGEFTEFTTDSGKSVELDYTGNYITITDSDKNEFTDINFTPQQKAGSEVAILLAQSEVNAEATTISSIIESTITVDNVGRGSNGGEIVIGSTSSSNSSTGVERINVIVENSSVVSDISSTNDALDKITLTNGEVKGDFVLANADFDAGSADTDNVYSNVDQVNLVKEGLTSIIATDFDGDIVLGRDNDLIDLGTLSAAVNGDVTYNATLNDDDSYTATTGNGADTINITLDDNRIEANTDTDTAVTISTGAANDVITVDEDNASVENTTATIDAGSGDDVVNGNDVAIDVEAGSGDDVVYAENTGIKALLNIGTSGLYGSVTPATATTAVVHPAGSEIHLLAGKQVQITIATDGNAATLLANGYESSVVTIEASSGTLTTIDDLNAAVLEAINEDEVLNKIVEAYVDENNDVLVKYLVDGEQDVAAISLEVTDPAPETSVSTAMLNEYRDLINDSTYTSAALVTNWNTAAAGTTASTATAEGSTIAITAGANTGNTVTVMIGDDEITYTGTGADNTDAAALVDALVAKGYTADDTVAGTVAVVTDKEITFTDTVATATITNDAALTVANIATFIGTDSIDADNANVVNGNSGDDVIVLSSDDTLADTVEYTDYSQGEDTIVHFVSATDKLDFTAYLTGTVDGNNNGSSSDESEVALANTSSATEAFTANSINLLDFNDLDGIATGVTFESATAAQIEAALNTDDTMSVVASTNGIYQSKATSVLIIEDDANAVGAVTGDIQNDGTYKAYEVTYNDSAVAATVGGTAGTYTVKLIGQFDLGDDANLVVGDLSL